MCVRRNDNTTMICAACRQMWEVSVSAADGDIIFPTPQWLQEVVASHSSKTFPHTKSVIEGGERLHVPTFREEFGEFMGDFVLSELNRVGGHNTTEVEYSMWNFFPQHMGHIGGANKDISSSRLTFSSPCFSKNVVSSTVGADGRSIDITWTASGQTSDHCTDDYAIATVSGHKWHTVRANPPGPHKFTWALPEDATEGDLWDLQQKGIRIFRYKYDYPTTLKNVASTLPLFVGMFTKHIPTRFGELNVEFMKEYAGFEMVPQKPSLNQVKSGDTVSIYRRC